MPNAMREHQSWMGRAIFPRGWCYQRGHLGRRPSPLWNCTPAGLNTSDPAPGQLSYACGVGSGFTSAMLDNL
jgi:hypothetical protein